MASSRFTRFVDALLLLSLRIKEVDGEKIVTSTSCVSSSLLNELYDMQYLAIVETSGKYMITERGYQVLDQIKHAPWGIIDINMSPPVAQT